MNLEQRTPNTIENLLHLILEHLTSNSRMLNALADEIALIRSQALNGQLQKEWYNTKEVAEILDVADYTVREKWCNQRRINATKDPDTGKWRIHADEVKRLQNGGGLLPQDT